MELLPKATPTVWPCSRSCRASRRQELLLPSRCAVNCPSIASRSKMQHRPPDVSPTPTKGQVKVSPGNTNQAAGRCAGAGCISIKEHYFKDKTQLSLVQRKVSGVWENVCLLEQWNNSSPSAWWAPKKALCDTKMLLFHYHHGLNQNVNLSQVQSITPCCFNNKVHCIILLCALYSLQTSPKMKWGQGKRPELKLLIADVWFVLLNFQFWFYSWQLWRSIVITM